MQEQLLRFFQDISNPILDQTAEFITMLGEQYFFILIISFLFWNISKKDGFKLAAAFIFSSVINAVLKISFHTPRPFEKLDYITGKRIETATGYSFPSGHTQGSSTFFITLAQIIRRKWFSIVSIIIIFLVAISRIYLGVHWPVDVVAAVVIGIFVSFIFCTLIDRYFDDTVMLRKIFFRLQAVVILLTIILFLIDAFYLKGSMKIDDFFKITGISTGAMYGFFIEERYVDFSATDANKLLKIIRYIIGLLTTLGIMTGLKIILPGHYLSDFLRYCIVGAWVTLIWPAAGVRLRLFNKRSRVD